MGRDYPLPELVRAELVRLGIRTETAAAPIGFHSLRHTWSTLAEAAGVPEPLRKCVMGHAPSVTERYVHRSVDRLRAELEKVRYPRPARRSTR